MALIPIQVGVVQNANIAGKLISGGWRFNDRLLETGTHILRKMRYTCQACGFVSRPSKQIPHGWMIPVDLNHPALVALDKQKGTCLCPLCASALAINWSVCPQGHSGKETPAPGMLVMFPFFSQAKLNTLALHVLSILSSGDLMSNDPLVDMARNVDNTISALSSALSEYIPLYRSEQDADFARALALLPGEYYEQRGSVIDSVRWWPTMSFWKEQGAYWMESTYRDLQDKEFDWLEVSK